MGFRPSTLNSVRSIMYPNCNDPTAASVADRYDYSHPVTQHDKGFDAAQFDGLLTDYDRILLRFGMHILWQL
jgi:hypothetical protein